MKIKNKLIKTDDKSIKTLPQVRRGFFLEVFYNISGYSGRFRFFFGSHDVPHAEPLKCLATDLSLESFSYMFRKFLNMRSSQSLFLMVSNVTLMFRIFLNTFRNFPLNFLRKAISKILEKFSIFYINPIKIFTRV